MQAHHYLGALPKIGNTLWYIATVEDQWLALLSFSAPALKCSARDQWIGWGYRHQYNRLNLVANNSRFLIYGNPFDSVLAFFLIVMCFSGIVNLTLSKPHNRSAVSSLYYQAMI